MKRIATIFLFILFSAALIGQGAVAVNDSTQISLGELITVHVTANDYHPDGKSFKIQSAFDSYAFTDSTITFFAEYDAFYNIEGYISIVYILIDEDNVIGEQSIGRVYIDVNNEYHKDYLDANNIKARINAWGNQFWQGTLEFNTQEDTIHFEYPLNSGKNTIFNQSLWVGGYDNSALKLSAERYRQTGKDYWTGPLSDNGTNVSIDSATVYEWNKVWKLDVQELIYHRTHWNDIDYEPIEVIKTWPAHGDEDLDQNKYLAPFIDVDEDGLYDPYLGDYPLIRGDQCIYFIFNDLRTHSESESEKIGLEIHGMAYEFSGSNMEPMNNTVFLSYKIFNRSNSTLNDTYIGLFCDFDLGYAYDDFVGCDVARGAFYGYNGEEIDGSGQPEAYGENPPAQGIVILGGPYMDSNGLDDPDGGCDESITGVGFGDGIIDNERYGMTKFLYFNNSSGVQGDPQTGDEYYNFMNGVWKDGTAMEYGGNGHISSGAYGPACNFMFPGLSDPCYWGTNGEEPYGPVEWTEEIAGNNPADRRGLSVMGPFTFQPKSMHKVDLAFVTARGENGPFSSVDLLKEYIDAVKQEYYEDSEYFGYQWLGKEERKIDKQSLNIYPNPASDEIQINHDSNGSHVQFVLYDAYGRSVKSGEISGIKTLRISINDLEKGIYILKLTDNKKVYSGKVLKN